MIVDLCNKHGNIPKIAQTGDDLDFYSEMVRQKGLEPSRPKALAPKASASTNSATAACGDCSICAAKLPPK